MPTRKQKRRDLKAKRHDYEFVYLDGDGNELDEVPEELVEPKKERTNGSKPAAGKKAQPARRAVRQPPAPSWNRAVKRGSLFGALVLALLALTAKGRLASVLPWAVAYAIFFIPFTYFVDRFAYRRWLARQPGGGTASTKKQ
jgi:hypothetical protein